MSTPRTIHSDYNFTFEIGKTYSIRYWKISDFEQNPPIRSVYIQNVDDKFIFTTEGNIRKKFLKHRCELINQPSTTSTLSDRIKLFIDEHKELLDDFSILEEGLTQEQQFYKLKGFCNCLLNSLLRGFNLFQCEEMKTLFILFSKEFMSSEQFNLIQERLKLKL